MKIYSVRQKNDGLIRPRVYTSEKALFDGIKKNGYGAKSILFGDGEIEFTYNNLLATLKEYSNDGEIYALAFVNCEDKSQIIVIEHEVIS